MVSPLRIGIAGAGLLGRLAAWSLSRLGHSVSVFDPAEGPNPRFDGQGAAGFTAAGMLSPLAELDAAEADVAAMGWRSIEHWSRILQSIDQQMPPPHFDRRGSLLVAHGSDLGAAQRVLSRIQQAAQQWPQQPEKLSAQALAEMEPALHGARGPLHAWLLPGEGAICTVGTLKALHAHAHGVHWHWQHCVTQVRAGELTVLSPTGQESTLPFDWVWDLRGAGAKSQLPVRGVRGEVIWLHAPEVVLTRPVRLLHPRHRVYIVPRPGNVYLVGASEIESEDRSNVSLRSAVELMAAAHSIVPGLAEARILRMDSNLRPAMPDNRPHLHQEPGLVRINGLYRHGWLLAPALLDDALTHTGLLPAS